MTSTKHTGRIVPGLIAFGILVVLLAFTAGCTQQPAVSQGTATVGTTPAQAGLPNPASAACVNSGGSLEIKKDPAGGEYGMCTFPNGTSCEEWALFHGEGCKSGVSVTTTSVSGEKKMVTYTDADNGRTVEVPRGSQVAIALPENPTTGFQWNATMTKGLELVSDNYETQPHREGMVGVGGTHTWIVRAKDSGDQNFSAVYRRSWEPVTGSETAFVLTIRVPAA